MSGQRDWLSRLSRDSKGIWGVIYPLGTSDFIESELNSTTQSTDVHFLYFYHTNEEILFRTDEINGGHTLTSITNNLLLNALEDERTSIRIVVKNFHTASFNQQCAIVKSARAIQETSSDFPFQFVFCGSWSYYSFREDFISVHGKTVSPAVELKNTLYAPRRGALEVIKLLDRARLITAAPTEMDRVACDFLLEQTAGDDYLINEALSYLQNKSGNWISNVEQVLRELVESSDVVGNITKRLASLDDLSKEELKRLLKVHWLVRSPDSVACDRLRVAGLITLSPIDGNKNLVKIAGPLINTVVRHVASIVGIENVIPPKDLCFQREVISAEAYRRIAELENILRSLVVSLWSIDLNENWYSKLNAIKSPAFVGQKEEDLILTVLRCMKDTFPVLSHVHTAAPEPDAELNRSQSRRQQEPLLDAALNWQTRQNEHHGVELAHNSIMHFLTAGNLKNVLFDKKHGFVGDDGPFAKESLAAALDEYTAIRDAVAHNQPVVLNTILRLDTLVRKFADWLTVFADQR